MKKHSVIFVISHVCHSIFLSTSSAVVVEQEENNAGMCWRKDVTTNCSIYFLSSYEHSKVLLHYADDIQGRVSNVGHSSLSNIWELFSL